MPAQHEPQGISYLHKPLTHYVLRTTLWLVLCLLPFLLSGSNTALAQDNRNRAGLVIQFPDGVTQTYCIPFDGDTISGLDLLLKSGLPVKVEAYGGLGAEICQIGDTGCPYPDQPCACQSYGPGGVYWSYHHLNNGQWKTSVLGAGSYRVRNGEVEGWAFSGGKPPTLYSFAQLCPAIQPEPQPTNTPQPVPPTQPPATALPVAPSPTPHRAAPTPTRKLQPISTPTGTIAAPTDQPNAQPLSPTPTDTAQPTATASTTPTTQPTPTSTLIPSATNTLAPQPTPTIRNPQSAIRNEDVARATGLLIGGLALGSLAIWATLTAIRRSRTGGGNVE